MIYRDQDRFNWIHHATVLCAIALSSVAFAQETPPPVPPADAPAEKTKPPESLDDLLGIDDDEKEPGAAEAAAKEAEDELQRKLNEAELANNFALAVEKMAISAELLDVRFDSGLGTQRVQEDILARLEHLIDQARKNQSRSQSSSSSSSSSSQQQQQQQQNPGQQQTQQQQSQANQRNNQPADSQEGDPPPMQQGDVNTVLEESRSEWGNLPPRVRDQLLQGRREKFSSLYERLTQEYYKRLAEEGTP